MGIFIWKHMNIRAPTRAGIKTPTCWPAFRSIFEDIGFMKTSEVLLLCGQVGGYALKHADIDAEYRLLFIELLWRKHPAGASGLRPPPAARTRPPPFGARNRPCGHPLRPAATPLSSQPKHAATPCGHPLKLPTETCGVRAMNKMCLASAQSTRA